MSSLDKDPFYLRYVILPHASLSLLLTFRPPDTSKSRVHNRHHPADQPHFAAPATLASTAMSF